MSQVDSVFARIAASRRVDPLSPVTLVVPSHTAGIQLRRRFAEEHGAFAGVRFETLPRLAELLGAGRLARQGRKPLARPIGDYVAGVVAHESRGALQNLSEMPRYPSVLRQIFRRLRRAGLRDGSDYSPPPGSGHLPEVLRLYGLFRQRTAAFYDDEDLHEAATEAVMAGAPVLADLGAVFVLPPGAQSAGAAGLLDALAQASPSFELVDEEDVEAETRFVLAPDPSTEAREAVREVISALGSGLGLHEVAIFHGADRAYTKLLRDALHAAAIPAALMPGTLLSEAPTGRAVLALCRLPDDDFSRAALMDFLELGQLRRQVPGRDGPLRPSPTSWDKLSARAGVTHGLGRWRRGLGAFIADNNAEAVTLEAGDWRRDRAEREARQARELLSFVEEIASRLEAMRADEPAEAFIARFKAVVAAYVDPSSEHLDEVLAEVEQLGTVGAVGGSFSLSSFLLAFEANLRLAMTRETSLGKGVFVGDYRLAAGLRFRHVVLCGAVEGALPAGPGTDAILDDTVWATMRRSFPFVEDAETRISRAAKAAERAVAAAGSGTVVWAAPLYEPGGNREYYPSPRMVAAAAEHDTGIRTATDLRLAHANGWLLRGASPLGMLVRGVPVDAFEADLRQAIHLRRNNIALGPGHDLQPALRLLKQRRSKDFTVFDGNLAELATLGRFALGNVSPTSLEDYATCGFRYFCKSVLRLNVVDEPEERETMDAAARGTLIHDVLHRFFEEQRVRGRPAQSEEWTVPDADRLLEIAEEELAKAQARGVTGLDVYAEHELRNIKADLVAFLEQDNQFRLETGSVPQEFEVRIPEVTIAGLQLRGKADRIDRTPDGQKAWVIDYKTGSSSDFKKMQDDPLGGGRKLQLPVYRAAAKADEVEAFYWFITRKGDFERVRFTGTPDLMARYERTLEAIVASIQAGAFPVIAGEEDDYSRKFQNCTYCDFDRICSRRRDVEQAEKAGDKAVARWYAIEEAASS